MLDKVRELLKVEDEEVDNLSIGISDLVTRLKVASSTSPNFVPALILNGREL